jgi:hypothetical protein
MTARGLFWLALGSAELPLLLEATSGCSFDASGLGVTPVLDNAQQCACTCATGSRSGSVSVAASSDDAEQDGSSMSLGTARLLMGRRIVGVRFAAAGVPQGATVTSAAVQFTADTTDGEATDLQIFAQLASDAATFSVADDDLSGRPVVPGSVAWSAPDWTAGEAGPAQRTSDLTSLVQQLVDRADWSSASPLVLRIEGTGRREAAAFDRDPASAPVLQGTFEASVDVRLPVCADPDIVAAADGTLPPADIALDCENRVAQTLGGLAEACGHPAPCTCALVDDPLGDDSFESAVCNEPCAENPVDPSCSNFDPEAFEACVAAGGTDCRDHLAATHASGDEPVCVASGSALALQLYGRRARARWRGGARSRSGIASRRRIPSPPAPSTSAAGRAWAAAARWGRRSSSRWSRSASPCASRPTPRSTTSAPPATAAPRRR